LPPLLGGKGWPLERVTVSLRHSRIYASNCSECETKEGKSDDIIVHLLVSQPRPGLTILHDTARVALEAGNSPEVIFAHYREQVTAEAAKAWFNVKP
jgi:hypothetical protein